MRLLIYALGFLVLKFSCCKNCDGGRVDDIVSLLKLSLVHARFK